jgi:hypothetical protein
MLESAAAWAVGLVGVGLAVFLLRGAPGMSRRWLWLIRVTSAPVMLLALLLATQHGPEWLLFAAAMPTMGWLQWTANRFVFEPLSRRGMDQQSREAFEANPVIRAARRWSRWWDDDEATRT